MSQSSKKHSSKFTNDKPVWKLDISPESKKVIKKTLIIAGVAAVAAVSAYSVYKIGFDKNRVMTGLNYVKANGDLKISAFGNSYRKPSELYSEIKK